MHQNQFSPEEHHVARQWCWRAAWQVAHVVGRLPREVPCWRRADHLRGQGGAHKGGTVALATFNTILTCLSDARIEVYGVLLCVHA